MKRWVDPTHWEQTEFTIRILSVQMNAVDDEAHERMDVLVRQMVEKQGVTEDLKARNQMAWVGVVNNIRNAAEEIVLEELIYR